MDRERHLLRMKIEKVDYAGDPHWELCNPSEAYQRGKEFIIAEITEQKMVLSSSLKVKFEGCCNIESVAKGMLATKLLVNCV